MHRNMFWQSHVALNGLAQRPECILEFEALILRLLILPLLNFLINLRPNIMFPQIIPQINAFRHILSFFVH